MPFVDYHVNKVCELKFGLFIILEIMWNWGSYGLVTHHLSGRVSIYYIIFIIVQGWMRFKVGSGLELNIRSGSELRLYPDTD